MSRVLGRFVSIAFILLVVSQAGAEVFRSERKVWQVGIESFSGDLSPRYEYLKSSIPDLIIRELSQADTHILSSSERIGYQKKVLEDKRLSLLEELDGAFRKRDAILFQPGQSMESVKDLEEDIEELKDKILLVKYSGPSVVEAAHMLPVQWVLSESGDTVLPEEVFRSSVISKVKDLDFLIRGSIREIDQYFRLEVRGYDRSKEREFVLYSGTSSPELLSELAVAAAAELRSIILGRAWAALSIETDNPEALIYCNGVLIGVGSARVNTLEPGEARLEALGQDRSYWSADQELTALDETVLKAELTKSESVMLSLDSNPTGADVYIGARWAGKTPLNLPRYRERSYWVTIRSEGYYDSSFEISPESSDMNISLEEEVLTRLEFFDLKKKEFYRSLGWFSLSVAAPVITSGISNNYSSLQNAYAGEYFATIDPTLKQEYYDLATEMELNYKISRGVFWGTIGISGGLLVDVFVKLSRYIKAAEALAE